MEIINGYPCKTCTDVDYAKKFIDPAHPKDGPHGVDSKAAKQAEAQKAAQAATRANDPAVRFGGSLDGLTLSPTAAKPSAQVDVSV